MTQPNQPTHSSAKSFRGGTWEGDDKLVVGIDIGTTQSGVAFAYLERGIGVETTFQRVTHWPGQGDPGLRSKVPSQIWYDSDKKAVLFGAEAATPDAKYDAEAKGWQLAKHFKLHLHPDELQGAYELELSELPVGIEPRQVYKDFLGYLFRHTRQFFEERVLDGEVIWRKHQASIQFIIAHPNGWGLREQKFLRTAAIEAGLVTSQTAPMNVRFVTEAEASVHYCIYHTTIENHLQAGALFAVCDAGGSTVDTTVYRIKSARPVLSIEEAKGPACVQAGAIFVDDVFEQYIRAALTNAKLDKEDVEEYLDRGLLDFENSAKRHFRGVTDDRTVDVASIRVNKPKIISRGRMSFTGATLKSFFDVCLDKIKASVDQQLNGLPVSHMFLVGGFGDSPYLREEFKSRYGGRGCKITLANQSTAKAVADGAVIWSVANSVAGRAPPSSLGIEIVTHYNPAMTDHQGREVYSSPDGYDKVGGRWSQIAAKDITLDTEAVVRKSFSRPYSTPYPDLEDYDVQIFAYSMTGTPTWLRDKQGELDLGFRKSCVISANLENLSGALQPRVGAHGTMYWRLDFDVCIRFGGTELEAYLQWEEDGKTHTGDVTIIPEGTI